MSDMQTIQWFPGHMTKTKRQIQASLKLVDAAAEIIDARIPVSSRNPELNKLIQNKPRVILMNKCDMANQTATKMWIDHYARQGVTALAVDCKSGRNLNKFPAAVGAVLKEKTDRLKAKGMKNPTMRIMIVGIPNVGKSSFINRVAGQNRAKVEDRPGVTRGNQWFTISKNLEMLDTPGVLWPLKRRALFVVSRGRFPGRDRRLKPAEFISRFKLEETDLDATPSYDLLQMIGKKRGMLIAGGEIDTERAAIMLLDEFRAAKLGRITVEMPGGELK